LIPKRVVEDLEKKKKRKWYIFYPNNLFKDFIWNALSIIMFIWTAIWAPFNMAFFDPDEKIY
jgi:hypothetical protein